MDNKVQQDFPIDWVEDNVVSRREFMKFLTVASGGLAAASGVIVLWSHAARKSRYFEPKLLGKIDDIPMASSMLFEFPRAGDLCILIRRANGECVAYSQRCTHLSCPVQYQPQHDRLYCPCHNGAFAVKDGRVLQGPPQRPLPRIVCEVRGDELWAVAVTLEAEHV